MSLRPLPENTIRYLDQFGRYAVPIPSKDGAYQAYRVRRIPGRAGPTTFMFDGWLIDADTRFPQADDDQQPAALP